MKVWLFISILNGSIQITGLHDAPTCQKLLLESMDPLAICIHKDIPDLRIMRK